MLLTGVVVELVDGVDNKVTFLSYKKEMLIREIQSNSSKFCLSFCVFDQNYLILDCTKT